MALSRSIALFGAFFCVSLTLSDAQPTVTITQPMPMNVSVNNTNPSQNMTLNVTSTQPMPSNMSVNSTYPTQNMTLNMNSTRPMPSNMSANGTNTPQNMTLNVTSTQPMSSNMSGNDTNPLQNRTMNGTPTEPMPSNITTNGTNPTGVKAQSFSVSTTMVTSGPSAGVTAKYPAGNGSISMNGTAPGNGTLLGSSSADSAFQTVTTEMRRDKEPEIPKCYKSEQTVHCGKLQGIYYKHGDGDFVHAELNNLPLDVPNGQKMIVVVCNYHNSHYDPDQLLKVPLLPKIVRDVGENAKLSVHIMNSANVDSLRGFKMETPENVMEPKFLIGPVVYGNIGEGASVRVKLMKSGNIHFGLYAREIELKLASLVGPLVKKFGEKCMEKVCISVDIVESGNIIGKDSFPEAKLKGAALVQPQIWAQCVKESTVSVSLKRSANIIHCEKISYDDHAKSIANLVFSEKAEEVKAKVEIEDSANMVGKLIAITGKESAVMGPIIKMKETENLSVMVEIGKSANLFADNEIKLSGTKVISEVVEVKEIEKGGIMAQIGSSGNLISTYGVSLEGGAKCLDSLIKLKEKNKLTKVMAKAVHVCNVWSRDIEIKDESGLAEYLINAEKPYLSAFSAKFMGVANAQMKRDLKLSKSVLLKSAIEIEDAKGKFLTKIEGSYSANALCYSLESAVKFEDESALVLELLEVGLETKEPSVVNAEIRLEYVGNAWAKTHSETTFVKTVFEQDEIGADRVSIGQNKVGKKLVCVPYTKDAKKKL